MLNQQRWFHNLFGDIPLVRQLLFRHTIIPTDHHSDKQLFKQTIVPTYHYSDSSVFRQSIWDKCIGNLKKPTQFSIMFVVICLDPITSTFHAGYVYQWLEVDTHAYCKCRVLIPFIRFTVREFHLSLYFGVCVSIALSCHAVLFPSFVFDFAFTFFLLDLRFPLFRIKIVRFHQY